MTNPNHTDTSRSGELEKCFSLGDCAWTVRQAVRGYVARHLALIEALEAENERLRGLVQGWHYLAVGPDEMGDYYTHKQLIKASEPYAHPALRAISGEKQ